ncbi:hypothetical protein P9112_002622 [Eukaryota sp. TZLM1-RC]
MSQNQFEQEALHYLDDKQIDTLLSQMLHAISTEQPQDISTFLLNYLESHATTDEVQSVREMEQFIEPPKPRSRRNAVSAPVEDEASLSLMTSTPKTEEEKAMLKDVLQRNMLFQHVGDQERNVLFDYMQYKTFQPNEVIIRQGEAGDEFYIVYTGTCEVYINENGEEKRVSTIHAGGSFGELALMYGTPRAATVTASSVVKAFSLAGSIYRSILMDASIKRRAEYEDFLRNVPILANLTDWERAQLADAFEIKEYHDEDIVKEGDYGDSFFVIKEGSCRVTKLVNGRSQVVGELTTSQFFGEIALMYNRPRAATVTAIGRVLVLKLDRSLFDLIVGPCEDILKRNLDDYMLYSNK